MTDDEEFELTKNADGSRRCPPPDISERLLCDGKAEALHSK